MTYPNFDPVIVRVGPLAIRWYGLMYLIGFAAAWFLIGFLARKRQLDLTGDRLSDLLFHGVLGVILGGRIGYVIFYNFGYFVRHPLEIFAVWQGGMSFHGGLIGVTLAGLWFCRKNRLPPMLTADIIATSATIGLGLGRLGNFINGELWGRVTDVPWGMVFPQAGLMPRHPSQLYELALEGVVLFLILFWLNMRQVWEGIPFFTFFLGYGVFRFIVEFFRQPDPQLGFLWGGATMGQLLSLPMVIFGLGGLCWVFKRRGG
ncbi:prolipoprotein diacylglyceryl transferase [Geothermobacter ehrlichii]|uniref:prolipoprotein diacylglyceryl transferase n=1 Tax=Geothermobacter ehrlichii TaxID=213224 RepID=UPI0016531804